MIDTSNQPMSIAIMQDDTVLAETTSEDKEIIRVNLCLVFKDLFEEAKLKK